jgi:hypothetical protein
VQDAASMTIGKLPWSVQRQMASQMAAAIRMIDSLLDQHARIRRAIQVIGGFGSRA